MLLSKDFDLLTQADHCFSDVDEDSDSFEANAVKKAQEISKETGLSVFG